MPCMKGTGFPRSLCPQSLPPSQRQSVSLMIRSVSACCFPARAAACRVVDLLGPLLQGGAQRQPPFDAVVASNAEPQNTVKVLLARWLGRPVLEPGWVEACCQLGSCSRWLGSWRCLNRGHHARLLQARGCTSTVSSCGKSLLCCFNMQVGLLFAQQIELSASVCC